MLNFSKNLCALRYSLTIFVSLVMHVDAIVRLTVRFLMNDLTSDPRHFKRDLFHLSPLIRDGSSLLSVSMPILSDSPLSQ